MDAERKARWMDGWMDGWARRLPGWIKTQGFGVGTCTDEWVDWEVDGWLAGQLAGWLAGWMDRQTCA